LQLLQLGRRPRVLLLYGSLRARSCSRFLTLEAARLLEAFGADTRIFDPSGLPLPDDAPEDHPKVKELRGLAAGSEAQVWCSPERHGAMTGVLKAQLDVRPTQGKTLAVMQVSGGSHSFNAVNQLRILGRWMRMVAVPNQSSAANAREQFDEAGRMRPSPYYDRLVDMMEELMKFTYLTRNVSDYLTSRYSEREGEAESFPRKRLRPYDFDTILTRAVKTPNSTASRGAVCRFETLRRTLPAVNAPAAPPAHPSM
jgi:arsenical resistance protein ArsH